MTKLGRALRQQLTLYLVFAVYQVFRLLDISHLPLTLWDRVYWGNIIKDSLLLFATGFLVLVVLRLIRQNPIKGPTVIAASKLKMIAYGLMGLFWLAVVIHTLFDSFKLVFPLTALPAYRFADLMDETVSHIFMFMPLIGILYVITFLEIQRPFKKSLSRFLTLLIVVGNFLGGILMGLNLTEGNLTLYTSWPFLGLLWLSLIYLTLKHRLDLRLRPWSLMVLSGSISAWLAFLAWALVKPGIPQLFSQLK